jgi:hypothetical protein
MSKKMPKSPVGLLLIACVGFVIYFQDILPMTGVGRDIFAGFLMVFGSITFYLGPSRGEYRRFAAAWFFFVLLQGFFATALYLAFKHALIPVRVTFNFPYWILLGALVCGGTLLGMAFYKKFIDGPPMLAK